MYKAAVEERLLFFVGAVFHPGYTISLLFTQPLLQPTTTFLLDPLFKG
jgi:hypothetical protein